MLTAAALVLWRRGVFTSVSRAWTGRRGLHLRRPLDLNHCSAEELIALGLLPESAARVLENRPYRNKFELLERMIVSSHEFELVRGRVTTTITLATGQPHLLSPGATGLG